MVEAAPLTELRILLHPTLVDTSLGGRVIEIDPKSGKVTELAGDLPIGMAAAPGMPPTNMPTGIGVGKSGAIYFSSEIENAIYKLAK